MFNRHDYNYLIPSSQCPVHMNLGSLVFCSTIAIHMNLFSFVLSGHNFTPEGMYVHVY